MKIYIETYGCAANQADSDTMKQILKNHDFVSESDAEILIINTCGVKGSTENKIFERLKKLRGRKVIVAGCLSKIISKKLRKNFPEFSLIGPGQIYKINKIVRDVNRRRRIVQLDESPGKLICLEKPKKAQPIVICRGCVGNCTYCATKTARGNLHSYNVKDILKSIKSSVQNGARTILITAQDTGAYGLDIGTSLPELLRKTTAIESDFKIRVGMMNPNHVLKFLDELIEIYKNPKIIKFVHIPLQSGSNKILRKMNRFYRVEDFKRIVKKFRKEIPDIKFSTDIICGFPGETRLDFEKTIKIIKETSPEVVNISKFYPRPGTSAREMPCLSTNDIKKRSRELSKIVGEMRNSRKGLIN